MREKQGSNMVAKADLITPYGTSLGLAQNQDSFYKQAALCTLMEKRINDFPTRVRHLCFMSFAFSKFRHASSRDDSDFGIGPILRGKDALSLSFLFLLKGLPRLLLLGRFDLLLLFIPFGL